MKKISTSVLCFIICAISVAQDQTFDKFNYLIGSWSGTGQGFGNDKSNIQSSFKLVMDGKFIEITNDAKFEPTEKKPDGEHHIDKGYISYDTKRDLIVCRQFFIEGFVIQYILNDSISSDSYLVFDSEHIENMPGGKARWTIKKISETEFEDAFEVAFPGKDFMCLGTNQLYKKP